MSPMVAYIVETFVTLLAVIALAVLVLYGARRLGVGRPIGPMHLIGRLPLDGRRAVYLVRIADQVLVLGVSEAGIAKLGEFQENQIHEHKQPERRFADILSRIAGTHTDAKSQQETGDA